MQKMNFGISAYRQSPSERAIFKMVSKWIRRIHRWLVIPFSVVLIVGIFSSITQGATPNYPPG